MALAELSNTQDMCHLNKYHIYINGDCFGLISAVNMTTICRKVAWNLEYALLGEGQSHNQFHHKGGHPVVYHLNMKGWD